MGTGHECFIVTNRAAEAFVDDTPGEAPVRGFLASRERFGRWLSSCSPTERAAIAMRRCWLRWRTSLRRRD